MIGGVAYSDVYSILVTFNFSHFGSLFRLVRVRIEIFGFELMPSLVRPYL